MNANPVLCALAPIGHSAFKVVSTVPEGGAFEPKDWANMVKFLGYDLPDSLERHAPLKGARAIIASRLAGEVVAAARRYPSDEDPVEVGQTVFRPMITSEAAVLFPDLYPAIEGPEMPMASYFDRHDPIWVETLLNPLWKVSSKGVRPTIKSVTYQLRHMGSLFGMSRGKREEARMKMEDTGRWSPAFPKFDPSK